MDKKQTNSEVKNQKSSNRNKNHKLIILGCVRNTVSKCLDPKQLCYNWMLTVMAKDTYEEAYRDSLKYQSLLDYHLFLCKFMCAFKDHITDEAHKVNGTKSDVPEYAIPSYNGNECLYKERAAPGMVLRWLKIRLYPDKTQTKTLDRILAPNRYVYNKTLWLKWGFYQDYGISLGRNALSFYVLNILRKDLEGPWLPTTNTSMLNQTVMHMLQEYEKSFDLHSGIPKFKRMTGEHSASFPKESIPRSNTFSERKVTLTMNLRDMRFRCSREYHELLKTYSQGIKGATLTRYLCGEYYLSFLVEVPGDIFPKREKRRPEVGLDQAVKDQSGPNKANVEENKLLYEKQQKKINRLHKHLSRKEEGSKNYEKLQKKLAKAYRKLGNSGGV